MASQLSGGIIYIGSKLIEDTISRISHGILIVVSGGQVSFALASSNKKWKKV